MYKQIYWQDKTIMSLATSISDSWNYEKINYLDQFKHVRLINTKVAVQVLYNQN